MEGKRKQLNWNRKPANVILRPEEEEWNTGVVNLHAGNSCSYSKIKGGGRSFGFGSSDLPPSTLILTDAFTFSFLLFSIRSAFSLPAFDT